jgi:HAD superfamily hydrolase (TIGR01509 family)
MGGLETILFDMGNVLIFHDSALLLRRMGALAGLAPEEVERRLRTDVWKRADVGAITGEQLQRETCERLGIELDEPQFAALWNCHFTLNTEFLPQVEALVGRVRLLLLSNTNALHAHYCQQQLPVLQRFDELLFSCDLGCVKPDPQIFRIALERAGTAPEATAFFDDIPEFVAGARALGIRAEVFAGAQGFPEQLRRLGLAPA